MKAIYRKILFAIVVYGIYYPICYIILIPEIFYIPLYLISFLICYSLAIIDTLVRPIKEQPERPDKYEIIMILLFIFHPFLIILAFYENVLIIVPYLSFWNNVIISYIGLALTVIGGLITLIARMQLGKYATGELMIQQEHQLVQKGLYRKIRHPIYLGGLIGIIGFPLVLRSLIVTITVFVLDLLVFIQRMDREEKLLQEEFGDEYRAYMKESKRLIPHLY